MAKRKTTVPFTGTQAQEAQLRAVIAKYADVKGALMPVLQEAQAIYGYLPIEVQNIIADGLNQPLSEVYGVVSFYSQFTLNPKGENQINVCMGTACYVKGAGKILENVKDKIGCEVSGITQDGKFSLDATRCIGACGLAPVMIVNEEVYGRLALNDIDRVLEKYMK